MLGICSNLSRSAEERGKAVTHQLQLIKAKIFLQVELFVASVSLHKDLILNKNHLINESKITRS